MVVELWKSKQCHVKKTKIFYPIAYQNLESCLEIDKKIPIPPLPHDHTS